MTKIDFHADDYALTENSDNDIIALCKCGALDSVSVIPNLKIFDDAAQKISQSKKSFSKNRKSRRPLKRNGGRLFGRQKRPSRLG